jgi:hypothetical protein
MEKQTLDQLEAELREIIRIEQVMKYSLLTPVDVISLKKLAEKGLPRAELMYGVFKLAIELNKVEGHHWLNRCKRHCNEFFLLKLSKINYLLKELSKERININ